MRGQQEDAKTHIHRERERQREAVGQSSDTHAHRQAGSKIKGELFSE